MNRFNPLFIGALLVNGRWNAHGPGEKRNTDLARVSIPYSSGHFRSTLTYRAIIPPMTDMRVSIPYSSGHFGHRVAGGAEAP